MRASVELRRCSRDVFTPVALAARCTASLRRRTAMLLRKRWADAIVLTRSSVTYDLICHQTILPSSSPSPKFIGSAAGGDANDQEKGSGESEPTKVSFDRADRCGRGASRPAPAGSRTRCKLVTIYRCTIGREIHGPSNRRCSFSVFIFDNTALRPVILYRKL